MNTHDLRDREYLGDGVNVGNDGYNVVLWLDNEGGYGPNAIALEPGVLARLDAYRERVEGAAV